MTIVKVAAHVCGAPISVINLIDETRQWFKAEIGLGVRETPLDVSICAHAILQPGLFIVPDTLKDRRFACNPLVTGEPNLRFYAGALLETPEGLPLGTVCVLDYKPRELTERARIYPSGACSAGNGTAGTAARPGRSPETGARAATASHSGASSPRQEHVDDGASIMGSTARASETLKEFQQAFTGRVMASGEDALSPDRGTVAGGSTCTISSVPRLTLTMMRAGTASRCGVLKSSCVRTSPCPLAWRSMR